MNGMHIHRFERLWIRLSIALLIVFGIAVAISAMSLGFELPGIEDEIEWGATASDLDPNRGWIRELGPGRYEVNMWAFAWGFEPGEIRVPAGSTVTFYLRSRDYLHGFKIQDTTVSLMAIPGQLGVATYTFDKPGEYLFLCHEYCGRGHHYMAGKIIVEEV